MSRPVCAAVRAIAPLAFVCMACGGDGGTPGGGGGSGGSGSGGGGGSPGIDVDITGDAPELLSAMGLFTWDGAAITYAEGVVPYELNTALFSDYALKDRAIYVPEGEAAPWDETHVFDFPPGTAIVKTFLFPADFRTPAEDVDIIETRVLIRYEDGWQGFPYIWRPDGSDAELSPAGEVRDISFTSADGSPMTASYLIPQRNQCLSCHERVDPVSDEREMVLIGPKARNVHRDGQLDDLVAAGFLTGAPSSFDAVDAAVRFDAFDLGALDTMPWEDLNHATRDYLDVNCAHCHNPNGVHGQSTQLFLNWTNDDEFNLGVCKRPGSAGAGGQVGIYDIDPGNPDESILLFRVETTEIGAMMPLVGRSLTHTEGAALVRAWITRMPLAPCPP